MRSGESETGASLNTAACTSHNLEISSTGIPSLMRACSMADIS
jgi:hypothetical protein